MPAYVRTSDRRLLTRRCVACGYDGSLLRAGAAPRCARCGCDLRQRPARSYAEMEGLLGRPLSTQVIVDPFDRRLHHCLQRWLAFLFCAMLGVCMIVFLAARVFAEL